MVKKSGVAAKVYDAVVLRWWWVLLFLGTCYLFYFYGMQKKNLLHFELKRRLHHLEKEKQVAFERKEDLNLQINSQSDPAWIQMTLMKGLGVVPEGQVKVYFKKEE